MTPAPEDHTEHPPLGQQDHELDLVLTVTCRDHHAERADLPDLRWFTARLAREDLGDFEPVAIELAMAEVALLSLEHGIDQAFLQADMVSGDLAAPLEDLLELDRTGPVGAHAPRPRVIVIVDRIAVPPAERGHGYGLRILHDLCTHFEFLTGTGLIVAHTAPDGWPQMDPFTLRAATRRLASALATAGMHRIGHTHTWYADLAAMTRNHDN